MKLRDILPDHPVQIMVRTNYPENLLPSLSTEMVEQGLLVGYCHWNGEELISDDGDYYSVNEVVSKYGYIVMSASQFIAIGKLESSHGSVHKMIIWRVQ